MKLEIDGKFKEALELLEHGAEPLFVTGRAGTGKSTLLSHFAKNTKLNMAVLAPTGVAALNVQGQTIHSFFGFRPSITEDVALKKGRAARAKQQIYKNLHTLVIDEISMVRADLLDCVDAFLRGYRKTVEPFGGVRMIFIGDVFQLPPVMQDSERDLFSSEYQSPYFFDAKVMSRGFRFRIIELDKIFRQKHADFIGILNAIRDGSLGSEHLKKLNSRVESLLHKRLGAIVLTTTNAMADAVNQERLAKLPGKIGEYCGVLSGDFDERQRPTDEKIQLKKGARVMFLNNDRENRWVNGTLGDVVEVMSKCAFVQIVGGDLVKVEPHAWELTRYVVKAETGTLEHETIGTYTQLPLRLAWAVTIHKSQGKTFDEVRIDFGRGTFAHGQAYVALSRCRTLEGLTLVRPFRQEDVRLDPRVTDFMTNYSYDRGLTQGMGF